MKKRTILTVMLASVLLALVMMAAGCASSGPAQTAAISAGTTDTEVVDDENLVPTGNWEVKGWTWENAGSTFLEYWEEADGVVKCTISGGKAIQYACILSYTYPVEREDRFVIKYRAWTESGTRTPYFVYYYDETGKDVYYQQREQLKMTTEPKVFTIVTPTIVTGRKTGDGKNTLGFYCAGEVGTFYVQMLSIEPLKK